ncbi:MAG TPA: serine hydrolase [Allosphingosinicella sp.]|uniref:serine hydrolase n=1 Tax=Allosphingosinicella sp. TaxID=2823234 RepID=UPI002ED7B73B
MRLTAILFWLLAFTAQPAFAASAPELKSLEQQLSLILASKSGDHGVAALDLATGEIVGVAADEPFPMASTVKIAIAAHYLAEVEAGRRSMNDIIAGRSAASLMDAMIITSDNHATDLLLMNLGGPAATQRWLHQKNIYGLRVDRTIDQLLRARRDLYDVRDSSTPRAMVNLLGQLDKGNLLQPWSRFHLLSLMERCKTGKNRIRGMLPFGTQVQNKTGTLNGLTTDVGFITLPDGRRLAVAFFARHGTDRPRTIAETARTVYDGFLRWVKTPFGAKAGVTTTAPALVPQTAAPTTASAGFAVRASTERH